jgi:hypothetical protein
VYSLVSRLGVVAVHKRVQVRLNLLEMMEQNFQRWSLDDFFLKNVAQSMNTQTRRDQAGGIELIEERGGISTETLKLSLKKFNGIWARKTGIEKTLLVQEGIKKVQYSKEAVAVEFYWERFLDGEKLSPAPDSPLRTPETKEPTPKSEVGPSVRCTITRWCPRRESNPCYGLERAVT